MLKLIDLSEYISIDRIHLYQEMMHEYYMCCRKRVDVVIEGHIYERKTTKWAKYYSLREISAIFQNRN